MDRTGAAANPGDRRCKCDRCACDPCTCAPKPPGRATACACNPSACNPCACVPGSQHASEEFRVHTRKLREIVDRFVGELERGLASPGQTLKALPSFVTRRPDGQEQGTYLALDLGGTNLRVCEVVLAGMGKLRMRQKHYTISEEVKCSGSEQLFDFITASIVQFLDENGVKQGRNGQGRMRLGFTFSFPVDQTAIDCGTLMHWNKGFEVSGVVNLDVVGLLRAALLRQKLEIDVVAIVNDTVGTLMSSAYVDSDTQIGVILGTGTNAAYVEKVSNITKWKSDYGNKPVDTGDMIINIEWGAFDNEQVVLPVTKYDRLLDQATENRGKQIFEKMISGLYLGEIARYVLLDLVEQDKLFAGTVPEILAKPYRFETQFMSRIERDQSEDLSDVKALLEDVFEVNNSTVRDRSEMKLVCNFIGTRAARLSAAAVAGVITKMNKLSGCTVAIDGSVFEHYPQFSNRMYDALRELFGSQTDNVQLKLARDGSGVGAALTAAVMGGHGQA